LVEIRGNLQQRVEERTAALDLRASRLESATIIGKSIASIRDLHDLLDNAVNQIAERFGYYHVGLFLANENKVRLIMVSSSSDGGKILLASGSQSEISREGLLINLAAFQKRTKIEQKIDVENHERKFPELARTRSQAAFPLLVQNQLIGVLDIHSDQKYAFSAEDVSTLQTLSDQIALAIENIRLDEQSRSALENLKILTSENISKIWRAQSVERPIGYSYTPFGVKQITRSDNLYGEPGKNAVGTIQIPIKLRGQAIGNISLQRKTNDANWTDDEIEMVEQLSIQIALAVENARVLEELENRALREKAINEFSDQLARSLDIETLLQIAAKGIYHLPQVSKVSLLLNPENGKRRTE
jgi:GAF domain-containing protein